MQLCLAELCYAFNVTTNSGASGSLEFQEITRRCILVQMRAENEGLPVMDPTAIITTTFLATVPYGCAPHDRPPEYLGSL